MEYLQFSLIYRCVCAVDFSRMEAIFTPSAFHSTSINPRVDAEQKRALFQG